MSNCFSQLLFTARLGRRDRDKQGGRGGKKGKEGGDDDEQKNKSYWLVHMEGGEN